MARVLPFAAPSEAPAPLAQAEVVREPLGSLLVRAGVVSQAALNRALAKQADQDQRLGRILIADRQIAVGDLTAALSRQSGLGEVDLAASPPDLALARTFEPEDCLALDAIPWRQVGGTRIIALSAPDDADEVIERFGTDGAKIALALASPDAIRQAITQAFSGPMRDAAMLRCPVSFSCRGWGDRGLGTGMKIAAGAGLTIAFVAPGLALQALFCWIMLVNAMTMGLRAVALFARFRRRPVVEVPDATRLSHFRKLPQISILVPLLREEAVAKQLLEALGAMDYPPALLDIKLVLEEDDAITRAAIGEADLPSTVEVITVPPAALRTKPRAMNYALPFCRGEIVGVYDAEDRPEPGQLRIVARHLSEAPPEVACVQGYLDFYNPTRNLLSRCFTLEYAIWFRVILLGVQRLGIPIPLGGTTVFFRRKALERVGAWDAFNVTEDADLGMRLARFGYRCEMIPSTTWEEANFRMLPWIRQRSRWLKGYAITWASHMRDPAALWRDLGPWGFLGFQVLFLGAITSYLSIPLFWLAWTATLGLGLPFWDRFPDWLVTAFLGSAMLGSAIMITIALVAARDTGRRGLWKWIPFLFVYWPLGAVAAYRAIGELFTRPFYWHKTEHGVEASCNA